MVTTTVRGGKGGNEAGPSSVPPSFECNICFDVPCDPVVTECGHLFCWRCLYKWMQTKSSCPLCPVCKAKVEKSKVIPVYGRGMQDKKDPRNETVVEETLPPRPRGHRTEPTPPGASMPFGGYSAPQARFGNQQFGSFSFTVFPSLFGLHFQYPPPAFGNPAATANGPARNMPAHHQHQNDGLGPMSPGQEQHDLISKLLMIFALFIVYCLLCC